MNEIEKNYFIGLASDLKYDSDCIEAEISSIMMILDNDNDTKLKYIRSHLDWVARELTHRKNMINRRGELIVEFING